MTSSRSKVLYEETYRKGEANIRKELLPERLPHFTTGTRLVSMELRKAGRVEIDGSEFEFQEIYVLCLPPPLPLEDKDSRTQRVE